jgi:hypothetical protein
MKLKSMSLFFLLFFAHFSLADRCDLELLGLAQKKASFEQLIRQKPDHPYAAIFQKYNRLSNDLKTVFREHEVYSILVDQEMSWSAKQLDDVLTSLENTQHSGDARNKISNVLRDHLNGKVPEDGIDARITDFLQGGKIYRALGEMNHQEVGLLLHGGNPLAPTLTSKLGKLINDFQLSTVVRKFDQGPGYGGKGPEKLVIAFDANSAPEVKKIIEEIHLLTHYHTPRQGTLKMTHEGYTFGWYGRNEIANDLSSDSNQGSLIIPILLSSTESQRVRNFAKLRHIAGQTGAAEEPWKLNGYCATGGYNSCTHWVGNIPLGDTRVQSYTFPGKVDGYASNSISPDEAIDRLPRTKELAEYNLTAQNGNQDVVDLTKMVWKVPGNQQLAYTLGLARAHEGGMLANPGWVAHTFLSRLDNQRSPFVFLQTGMARDPIPLDFDPKISAK